MRAIAIDGFGGPEVMYLADLPAREPADNEVRIRIIYAGVNPADWKLREGWLRSLDVFKPRFPFVLGYDGSGVVDAVGRNVAGVRPGDRVTAKSDQSLGQWGSFAEYLTVAADLVGAIPETMSLQEAATLPVAALTAWHGLFHHGRLQAGQSVFINAGAGGVGSFAVQFARRADARVFASCRPTNASYLTARGAETTFDYDDPAMIDRVRDHAGGIDLVLDAAGATNHDLVRSLRDGGTYVRIPSLGPDDALPDAGSARGIKLVRGGIVRAEARSAYEAIGKLHRAGRLRLPEMELLPIQEAKHALELSKTGRQRGKIVLKVWD